MLKCPCRILRWESESMILIDPFKLEILCGSLVSVYRIQDSCLCAPLQRVTLTTEKQWAHYSFAAGPWVFVSLHLFGLWKHSLQLSRKILDFTVASAVYTCICSTLLLSHNFLYIYKDCFAFPLQRKEALNKYKLFFIYWNAYLFF